ncbi:hypothetical protein L9F63_023351, partial [Diploptera punctata]
LVSSRRKQEQDYDDQNGFIEVNDFTKKDKYIKLMLGSKHYEFQTQSCSSSAITLTDEILRPSTVLLLPSSVLPSMVEFMNFEIKVFLKRLQPGVQTLLYDHDDFTLTTSVEYDQFQNILHVGRSYKQENDVPHFS